MSQTLLKSKTDETVKVNPMIYDIGQQMDLKAQEMASDCGYLTSTIDVLAKAREDYEGGPFAVMFKVRENMAPEQFESLPDPDVDSGNNPGIYKIRVTTGKKPTVKEKKFYHVFSDRFPCNVARQARIDMLELSMKDPIQYNVSSVPQDIKDMDIDRRNSEISRLERALSTSRTNVLAAFELLFKLRKAHDLPGVNVSITYALSDKGELLDGEDGRECVVDPGKTPIHIVTTVKGREEKDKVDLSVGSFKKLRPDVAKERGGTYLALIESAPTVKRGVKGSEQPGGDKPDLIVTFDKFKARITDIHTFMRQDVWDAKDQAKYLELLKIMGPRSPAGNGDFKVSMYDIYVMLKDVFSHEPILKHVEELVESEITKAA